MKVMRFAMKMNFMDPVCDESLANLWLGGEKIGYRFDVRLNYYRGHFLSVIDEFTVKVDGNKVPEESIQFALNGKTFGLGQLKECYSEFWNILDAATVTVLQPGGLAAGMHTIELDLFIRSPYMATGPNHQYMPIDCSGVKELPVA